MNNEVHSKTGGRSGKDGEKRFCECNIMFLKWIYIFQTHPKSD